MGGPHDVAEGSGAAGPDEGPGGETADESARGHSATGQPPARAEARAWPRAARMQRASRCRRTLARRRREHRVFRGNPTSRVLGPGRAALRSCHVYTGPVKRSCRLAALLVVLLVVGPAGARADAQEVVEATLDNGLRVLLREDHRSPVASFQIWYRVGSRDERVGQTGLSHYLEHMMFKGTPTYGPRVFSKLVETAGGQDNAFTTRDATVYQVTVAAPQLDLVLELESDRMRHLLLDPREMDAERKVVREERRTRTEDDPVGALAELFNTVAFVAHPYRLPTIGFASDI